MSVHFLSHAVTYWKTFLSIIFSCISRAKREQLPQLLQTVVLPDCVRWSVKSGSKLQLAFRVQWPLLLQGAEILVGILTSSSRRATLERSCSPSWHHSHVAGRLTGGCDAWFTFNLRSSWNRWHHRTENSPFTGKNCRGVNKGATNTSIEGKYRVLALRNVWFTVGMGLSIHGFAGGHIGRAQAGT